MTRDSSEEALRRALAELEQAMAAAESERAHLERRRHAAPFWPDRRSPRRGRDDDPRAANRREQE
jgi:hypothetical protein